MKLIANISSRELSSLLQDCPFDKCFSTANSVENSDISVMLNQNSQTTNNSHIYPYDRNSGSKLNEYRDLMDICISNDFIFKQHLISIYSQTATDTNERLVEGKLALLELEFSKLASPAAKDLTIFQVIKSYKSDGIESLNGQIDNSESIPQLVNKIDSFLMALNYAVSTHISMIPKMGLRQSDVQCLVVADHLYEDISEMLKSTKLHAVTKSVYERQAVSSERKKEPSFSL